MNVIISILYHNYEFKKNADFWSAQSWILCIAPTVRCSTRISVLAVTDLREIGSIQVF